MKELTFISHNVRKYRKLAKMTQEVLSAETGIDRKFLSEVENAKKNLTVGTLSKIALALNIKVKDLFSEEI